MSMLLMVCELMWGKVMEYVLVWVWVFVLGLGLESVMDWDSGWL